jgi:hypothetical protein
MHSWRMVISSNDAQAVSEPAGRFGTLATMARAAALDYPATRRRRWSWR